MKRRRLIGLAIVALALAGLASLAAYRMMGRSSKPKGPVLQTVVAAANPLAVGVRIKDNDLKLVALPPGTLPQHVYHTVAEVSGRVLTVAAVPNQVIDGEMVAAPGSGAGLPPLIPNGMRAVSVKVNDVVSVAGFAVPGTHVDVLLTGNPQQASNIGTVTSITLLSDVQVLTAGQQLVQSNDGKPEQVTVITLLVTPEGAEKLALADGYGHIQLSLRNPLDSVAPKTAPVVNAQLYDMATGHYESLPRHGSSVQRAVAATHPPEPPAPPPAWAVEVIDGSQRQTVSFPSGAAAGTGPAVVAQNNPSAGRGQKEQHP